MTFIKLSNAAIDRHQKQRTWLYIIIDLNVTYHGPLACLKFPNKTLHDYNSMLCSRNGYAVLIMLFNNDFIWIERVCNETSRAFSIQMI